MPSFSHFFLSPTSASLRRYSSNEACNTLHQMQDIQKIRNFHFLLGRKKDITILGRTGVKRRHTNYRRRTIGLYCQKRTYLEWVNCLPTENLLYDINKERTLGGGYPFQESKFNLKSLEIKFVQNSPLPCTPQRTSKKLLQWMEIYVLRWFPKNFKVRNWFLDYALDCEFHMSSYIANQSNLSERR